MTRPLPPHPNLQQLKHQAKDLRKAHLAGAAESITRICEFLPRCAEATEDEVLNGEFSLQEAQHVIAGEYGFKHWKMLCTVVEADLDILYSLSDEEIKELLRVIDQEDFRRAFKDAGALVCERFLSNMSLRVRTFFLEAFETEEWPTEEVAAARRLILSKATELAAQGKIEWPDKKNADLIKMQKAIKAGDIEPLAFLSDREAQQLMREVDQKDMTTALVGSGQAVRDKFLLNMSARVRGLIRAEMEMPKADEKQMHSARQRVLLQAALCATRGDIEWPDGT